MTTRETLKDKNLRVIGFVETDDFGVQTLKDASFKVLGKYDPKTNTTKDFYGRLVGKGNILGVLLRDA